MDKYIYLLAFWDKSFYKDDEEVRGEVADSLSIFYLSAVRYIIKIYIILMHLLRI